MARRKSGFGTLLALGGLAAAGAAAYKNRDKLLGFVNELAGNVPGAYEPDIGAGIDELPVEKEADIVIDRSAEEPEAAPAGETAEPEAADGEA